MNAAEARLGKALAGALYLMLQNRIYRGDIVFARPHSNLQGLPHSPDCLDIEHCDQRSGRGDSYCSS